MRKRGTYLHARGQRWQLPVPVPPACTARALAHVHIVTIHHCHGYYMVTPPRP